jgi:putative membrane protein
MIRDYTDHAANERTFLAWVRTGIAIIGLGFVIEKFNLFLLTVATSISSEALRTAHLERKLERLSAPIGRFGGGVLVFGGIVLIAIATARFFYTEKQLNDREIRSDGFGRVGLVALSAMIFVFACFSAYIALG